MKKIFLRMTARRLRMAVLGLFMFAQPGPGLFAQTSTTFSIMGRLRNMQAGWIYLLYAKDGQRSLDSVRVHNGAYVFNGATSENQQAVLLDVSPGRGIRPQAKDIAEIYLVPGALAVTHLDSFSNTSFTGSAVNTAFKKIREQVKPYNERQTALIPRYKAAQDAKDEAAAKDLEGQYKTIQKDVDERVYAPFVKNNPQSPLALYVLELYAADNMDVPALQPLFDGLGGATRRSKDGAAFQHRLTIALQTSIGRLAPDFTQNDTLGKPVLLSSFRGKYVLLDFWASWCGPCRAENPNAVKAYAQYHAKGFDILSVSLDRPGDKDKWLKAIHADHLAWTQVSDLQFWNNAVAKEYGINSIPRNFLIDPKGRIIGKNLRGDELDKKLEEVYAN